MSIKEQQLPPSDFVCEITLPPELEYVPITDSTGRVTGFRINVPFYTPSLSDAFVYLKSLGKNGERLSHGVILLDGRSGVPRYSDRSRGTVAPTMYSTRRRDKAKTDESAD